MARVYLRRHIYKQLLKLDVDVSDFVNKAVEEKLQREKDIITRARAKMGL